MKQKLFLLPLIAWLIWGTAVYGIGNPKEGRAPLIAATVEDISISSKLLNRAMEVEVYLPKGYGNGQRYPVLYMMHGFDKDHTTLREVNMDQKASELIATRRIEPLIIVVPRMDNSFGLNSAETFKEIRANTGSFLHYGRYEDYLLQEVIPGIDSRYATITTKNGRYIGGISMGGYVSLRIGCKYAALFSKIGGHMPSVNVNPNYHSMVYPTEASREENNPIKTAERANVKDIQFYLDVGKDDSYRIIQGTKDIYQILQDKGVKVQFHLNEGTHGSDYIRNNMEEYLLFYAGVK